MCLWSEQETGRRYSYSCDWFALGVTLYELTEQAFPFSLHPQYEDLQAEFVEPELLDDNGNEIEHMFSFLSSLLDWDPENRLGVAGGMEAVKAHRYWQGVDWELAERGKHPSPLVGIAARDAKSASAAQKQEAKLAGRPAGADAPKGVTTSNEVANGLEPSDAGNGDALPPPPPRPKLKRSNTMEMKSALNASHALEGKVQDLRRVQDEIEDALDGDDELKSFAFGRSGSALSAADEQLLDLDNTMYVEEWEFSSPHAIAQEYIEMAADMVSIA